MKKDKKSNKKQTVLVAMSGGVDSSVAAALLARAGYDVIGAFMVNYDSGRAPVGDPSCWLPDYRDALRVAAHLGIPLLKLDFTHEYSAKVLSYLFREYKNGRTPNPDVLCNTYIKFGVWMDHAKKLGFDFLATGHYARLETGAGIRLLQAKDANKDQTYFLHQLSQEQLRRALFPIGGHAKTQVRTLAKSIGLPTADKEESMGICFVGEVPMREFLAQNISAKNGKVITTGGDVVGAHDGLPFYTIGQRHGFSQAGGASPWFVVGKDFGKNMLIVGHENDPALYKKKIAITDVRWVSGRTPQFPLQCEVRFRHRQPLQRCRVAADMVTCAKAQRAVTPGQFAVFYAHGECLGGGVVV